MEKLKTQKKKLLMTDDSIMEHFNVKFCQILVPQTWSGFQNPVVPSEEGKTSPKQHWVILHLVNHCLGMMGAHVHRTAVPTNRCLGLLKRGGASEQLLQSTPNCKHWLTASSSQRPKTGFGFGNDITYQLTSYFWMCWKMENTPKIAMGVSIGLTWGPSECQLNELTLAAILLVLK